MTAPAKNATCKHCDLEMNGAACTVATYEIVGKVYARIPFTAYDWAPEIVDCNDCGIHVGSLHHPCCDLEECPHCHLQAIVCGCVEAIQIR